MDNAKAIECYIGLRKWIIENPEKYKYVCCTISEGICHTAAVSLQWRGFGKPWYKIRTIRELHAKLIIWLIYKFDY